MEWRVRNVWKAWNYWVGIYINVDALEFEKTIPSYLISLNLIHYIIGEEILTKNFSNSILQKRKNSERERKDTLKIPTFPVGVIKSRIFNTHSNARRKFLFPFYKKEKKNVSSNSESFPSSSYRCSFDCYFLRFITGHLAGQAN